MHAVALDLVEPASVRIGNRVRLLYNPIARSAAASYGSSSKDSQKKRWLLIPWNDRRLNRKSPFSIVAFLVPRFLLFANGAIFRSSSTNSVTCQSFYAMRCPPFLTRLRLLSPEPKQ
nr:unnamed protein product [Spirometra erinaceieuropaei]